MNYALLFPALLLSTAFRIVAVAATTFPVSSTQTSSIARKLAPPKEGDDILALLGSVPNESSEDGEDERSPPTFSFGGTVPAIGVGGSIPNGSSENGEEEEDERSPHTFSFGGTVPAIGVGGLIPNNQETEIPPEERGDYLGCFVDKPVRAMPNYANNVVNVEECQNRCGNAGFMYAGLQDHKECWCANTYDMHGPGEDGDCWKPCEDGSSGCGGTWRISVYVAAPSRGGDVITFWLPDFARPGVVERDDFLGCFKDEYDRAMPNSAGSVQNVEECQLKCLDAGFLYAGVQDGHECWCGDSYGTYGEGDNGDCRKPCDDGSDGCGGTWRLSVYYAVIAPTTESPTRVPTEMPSSSTNDCDPVDANDEGYIGCYIDTWDRALNYNAGSTGSIQACQAICSEAGFPYYGLQGGHECWCGSCYATHGSAPESDCNRLCNNGDVCGGTWRLSVYTTLGSTSDSSANITPGQTQPTPNPSAPPSPGPSAEPTGSPTQPTAMPSGIPTETPTISPAPSVGPTGVPTATPTISPAPSVGPTGSPKPTSYPSAAPTIGPTTSPAPSLGPTGSPTQPTVQPSGAPSTSPTTSPAPSLGPTGSPTQPTLQPSKSPTTSPTTSPSGSPTQPTAKPSRVPTSSPTDSIELSLGETEATPNPSGAPTPCPTASLAPSPGPIPSTKQPTPNPSWEPTPSPTTKPPSKQPTPEPTQQPTQEPTPEPTSEPTQQPTPEPTPEPTPAPSRPPPGDFVIAMDIVGPGSSVTFPAAAQRWQQIIRDGPEPWSGNLEGESRCGPWPTHVDSVYMCGAFAPIDGPGNVAGYAGPRYTRNGFPVMGEMVFDSDEPYGDSLWYIIALHEMGHILGVGTLWDNHDLQQQSTSGSACPYKMDSAATREYQRISGCNDRSVPVEQNVGPGSDCSHFADSCFPRDHMSFNGGDLITSVTVASLQDIGYTVDFEAADPITWNDLGSSCRCGNGSGRSLRGNGGFMEDVANAYSDKPVRRLSAEGLEKAISFGKGLLAQAKEESSKFNSARTGLRDLGSEIAIVLYRDDDDEQVHSVIVKA